MVNERPIMKKLTLLLTTLALTAASAQNTYAGDKEWATAGKILTGVFAGSVLTRALEPAHTRTYHTTTTYYSAPAVVNAPVYVQPQVVYAQPAPVYVQSVPVYVQSAPVYVQSVPVYVQPRVICPPTVPIITHYHGYRPSSFGYHGHYSHHRHFSRW